MAESAINYKVGCGSGRIGGAAVLREKALPLALSGMLSQGNIQERRLMPAMYAYSQ